MLDPFALPRLRSRLTPPWNGPETPRLLARGLIERGHESANALVAARAAGDHQGPHGQRSSRGVVILVPVRHLGFPEQRARGSIERDEMRVIGDHEHAISRNPNAPVDTARGVADQALGPRALIVPDLSPAARVEGVALVRARHVHHAVHHDRRDLQARCVGQAEDPSGSQPDDVALVDLAERAVPAAIRLAVVAGPVGLRRDDAILPAALSEQVDPAIVTQQLQVVRALIEDQTRQRAAASEHDRSYEPAPARCSASRYAGSERDRPCPSRSGSRTPACRRPAALVPAPSSAPGRSARARATQCLDPARRHSHRSRGSRRSG